MRDLSQANPEGLSRLLQLEESSGERWQQNDVAEILRHQLAAPLEFDLGAAGPTVAQSVRRLSGSDDRRITSFADLLRHPCPPVELLDYAKQFFKPGPDGLHPSLPIEVATVLYYAVIATGIRCGRRVSSLDDGAMRQGFAWAIRQPWLAVDLVPVFREGLERLDGGNAAG
jgi:hypothetical protein